LNKVDEVAKELKSRSGHDSFYMHVFGLSTFSYILRES